MSKKNFRKIIIILLALLFFSSANIIIAANHTRAYKNDIFRNIDDNIVIGYDPKNKISVSVDISEQIEMLKNTVLPVDKEYLNVSSRFGFRNDPFSSSQDSEDVYKNVRLHRGLDLSKYGINGSNVYSVLDGSVKKVYWNHSSYGNYVEIDHNGFTTLYAHMSNISEINEGDKIKAGDIIGKVGSTGRSTGPHLHIEFDFEGILVNPELFIKTEDNIEDNEEIEVIEENTESEKEIKNISSSRIILDTGIVAEEVEELKEGFEENVENNNSKKQNSEWMPLDLH